MKESETNSPIEKLKSIIREYERLDNSQEIINEKRMAISENLSSTMDMLGDSKGETFNHISSLINEYINNSQIEMTILENFPELAHIISWMYRSTTHLFFWGMDYS